MIIVTLKFIYKTKIKDYRILDILFIRKFENGKKKIQDASQGTEVNKHLFYIQETIMT